MAGHCGCTCYRCGNDLPNAVKNIYYKMDRDAYIKTGDPRTLASMLANVTLYPND